jgi:hypothetical protein
VQAGDESLPSLFVEPARDLLSSSRTINDPLLQVGDAVVCPARSLGAESPAANELTGIRVDTEDVEAGVSEGTREVTLAALRNERMSKVRPGYTERRRDDEQPTS